jgi:hypothetical protein
MPVLFACLAVMATASQAATVTLYVGQTIDVGAVEITNDGVNLYVTFLVDAPWVLVESHVHVATSPQIIPQTNGNPIPGQFAYSEDDGEYVIPLGSWGVGTQLYIAAHAVVRNPDTYQEVSAWGDGTDFPGKNWATYFSYTVQEPLLVDTLQVYPDGTGYPSNIALTSGKNYGLLASGTYRFANWGEYGIADAQFNYRDAAHAPGGVPGWYELATGHQQVLIGGSVVDWQPPTFNPLHIYTLKVAGAGAPLVFSIIDSEYADNSGSLTLEIYELP